VRACYIVKGRKKYVVRRLGYEEKGDLEVDEDDIDGLEKQPLSDSG
jgi:hypothetical protein